MSAKPIQPMEYPAETTSVRIYLEEDMFSSEVVDRLRVIADHNRLTHPLVGLPDIHYKIGNFIPTGTTVATEATRILPCAIGNGTGCGFTVLKLNQKSAALKQGQVRQLFSRFMERIPIKQNHTPLSESQLNAALAEGLDSVAQLDPQVKERFDFSGNMFRDPGVKPDLQFKRYFPRDNYQKAVNELGILAAGNHFIELLEVVSVADQEIASWFGIGEGDLLLSLHADGNQVALIGKTFTPYKTFRNWGRIKQELAKVAFHLRFYKHPFNYLKQDELFTLATDSQAGRRFISFCHATTNFSFLNRYRLVEMLKEILQEQALDSDLFFDSIHDALSFENNLWVHRTGASVALPSDRHTAAAYQRFGKPVLLPCAMGLNSFLMVPGAGVRETYGSVNHGTGRIIDRTKVNNFTRDDIDRSMAEREVDLFCKGTFNITREHSSTFKDSARVKDVVEGLGLARIFAELKPLAVMKG